MLKDSTINCTLPVTMHRPTLVATNILLAVGLSAADVNPDAQGACEPTRGGSGACGPNGSEQWLNTGLKGSGWEPPFLDINKLSHISLDEYYNGVGKPCQKYDQYFRGSGAKYNIDPAILAFLAMQESSCNADEGGPTPGLMQCDPGNCQNGKDSCQYPIEDNTDCGAHVLRQALDGAGGNAVHALGSYNGWFTASDGTGLNGGKGLTEGYPCSDEGKAHGVPQNLNYLHETLNGWFQGYDMYGADRDLDGEYDCDQNCNSGSGLC
ncbi:glycoside hydrolase family 23 protein [Purpureocillium lilacinum]|uniref:Glycoside hydrolase family 23 protein n=2 Tax=Purpureocillium lilacinum TaxID=33203 RepID=A0A2U3EGN0_PURLI|nr:glycoside hydrolase family 23 protein [Purpureocillium lilacinum]